MLMTEGVPYQECQLLMSLGGSCRITVHLHPLLGSEGTRLDPILRSRHKYASIPICKQPQDCKCMHHEVRNLIWVYAYTYIVWFLPHKQ